MRSIITSSHHISNSNTRLTWYSSYIENGVRSVFSEVQSYRDCAHDDHTSFLIPWYKAIAVWCFDQHLLYGLHLGHRCQPIQNWVTFLQYFCNWALWRNFSSDFFSFPFFSFLRCFFDNGFLGFWCDCLFTHTIFQFLLIGKSIDAVLEFFNSTSI